MIEASRPAEAANPAAASSGLNVSRLRSMVESAVDMTSTARRLSERDRDYYDNFDNSQWTPEEKALLRKRKQPIVTDNRIKRKVDALIGLEMRSRVDPRALPRTPDDEEAADIATKALVFADDIARLDVKRSQFAYNLAIEGYGGVEVAASQRGNYIDPDIIRLRWEEIFYDPHSRETDFSDANYMGVQKWMAIEDADAYCRKYFPGIDPAELAEMLESSMQVADASTYDDRPRSGWGDKRSRRVRLAYMYYRHGGEWRRVLFGGAGVIQDTPSPFLDKDGNPDNAMILSSCYVDRDNRRYGIVRDWISQQEEINKRRSKLLHQLSTRQTKGHAGAIKAPSGVDPIAHLKAELAKPDGHVEYEQDPMSSVPGFDIIPQGDQIAGQFQLLQESKQAIDNVGPNASLLGQMEGNQSGRAIQVQQQAGLAELGPYYESIREWTLRVYRALWCRIRQYWTEPRWIRVTEEPEKLQFIGINLPVVNEFGFQVGVENEIAELDVDIIIDMMPEFASLQQEEWEQLMALAHTDMVQIPPELLIEASHLRNKGKLLEMLNGEQAQQAQAQQMEVQMRAIMAKIAKEEAQAQDAAASAEKKQAETAEIISAIGNPQMPEDRSPEYALRQADLAIKARAQEGRLEMDRARLAQQSTVDRERLDLDRFKVAAALTQQQNQLAGF